MALYFALAGRSRSGALTPVLHVYAWADGQYWFATSHRGVAATHSQPWTLLGRIRSNREDTEAVLSALALQSPGEMVQRGDVVGILLPWMDSIHPRDREARDFSFLTNPNL